MAAAPLCRDASWASLNAAGARPNEVAAIFEALRAAGFNPHDIRKSMAAKIRKASLPNQREPVANGAGERAIRYIVGAPVERPDQAAERGEIDIVIERLLNIFENPEDKELARVVFAQVGNPSNESYFGL